MPEFLAYREKMDPYQLFVTPYWREILSISTLEKESKIGFFRGKPASDQAEQDVQKRLQM